MAGSDIVELVDGIGIISGSGQKVGLNDIGDIAKVASGFSIAIDVDWLSLDHRGNPGRDDCCIGAFRVLARTENIKVTQPDGRQSVAASKDVGVKFVTALGDSVGGERVSELLFYFGQMRVIAVNGATGRENEAPNSVLFGGEEDVQEPGNIGFMGFNWLCNG